MNATEQARHETVFDDHLRRVAGVYADALLNVAEKRQQADTVQEELQTLIDDVFGHDPQLEAFFASRAIGRDRKGEVLQKAFDGRCSDTLADFLHVLNRHDRLDTLRAVAAAYKELNNQRAGRMRVQVRSAVPLADDQQERLRHELRETFQREPILEARVDPELLGGIVVKVGDWLYDASVRTRLENIRKQLIERSSHVITT
jgi:F-type H+-transporting ATPase subunit delta